MGRFSHAALLILASLALASCSPTDESHASSLGTRISGTWLGTYQVNAPAAPETPFIRTYHPDGTAETTSSRMFGAGDPDRNGLSSTHHLQWEATGDREITWRLLHFGHNVDGSLRHISRTHGVVEFDEAYEESRGSFQVEVLEPADLLNPLNPNNQDAQPIFTASGTSVARRLHTGGSGH